MQIGESSGQSQKQMNQNGIPASLFCFSTCPLFIVPCYHCLDNKLFKFRIRL